MKTRRRILLFLAAGMLLVPLLSFAQKPAKPYRIGVLAYRRRPASFESDYYGGLSQGLRELGYTEGKDVLVEWRFADGDYGRVPGFAAELVRLGVDVIVADGTPPTLAAQKESHTIPIVFGSAGDPVGNGLIRSLAHPGGNTTGVSTFGGDSNETAKQLDLLRSIVPRLSRVAVLCNGTNPYTKVGLKTLQSAAETFKVQIVPIETRNREEILEAFVRMTRERVGAFLFVRDALWYEHGRLIAELALKNRLPYLGGVHEHADWGGLMSYGLDLRDNWRRVAGYVDKIRQGANPGDIPVEQPTKYQLVINRKTAKALGLTIPPDLLVLADRVID